MTDDRYLPEDKLLQKAREYNEGKLDIMVLVGLLISLTLIYLSLTINF